MSYNPYVGGSYHPEVGASYVPSFLSPVKKLNLSEYSLIGSINGSTTSGICGLYMSTDGTKMFVSTTEVWRFWHWTLATAWDITTATYDYTYTIIPSAIETPSDIQFSADGTQVYVLDQTYVRIATGTLSTAWDGTTCGTLTAETFDDWSTAHGMYLTPNGDGLYIVTTSTTMYRFYNSSGNGDISEIIDNGTATTVELSHANNHGVWISHDGTKMAVLSEASDGVGRVYTYRLTTPYDITTAELVDTAYTVDQMPHAIFCNSDESYMYIGTHDDNYVRQYELAEDTFIE